MTTNYNESEKAINIRCRKYSAETGWDTVNDSLEDEYKLGNYGTKLPDENTVKGWLIDYFYGNLDYYREQSIMDELWDEANTAYGDTEYTAELVDDATDEDERTVYDTMRFWASDLARDELASRLDLDRAIIDLACDILGSDTWDMDDLARLCEAAGMTAEWEAADDEDFEEVAKKAAEKLGVKII